MKRNYVKIIGVFSMPSPVKGSSKRLISIGKIQEYLVSCKVISDLRSLPKVRAPDKILGTCFAKYDA